MAKTPEDEKSIQEQIEERRKCIKIIEKKVKGGLIKSAILLENVNETTGAALTWIKYKDHQIEIPITKLLGILLSLADSENQATLNRMLKAQCNGFSYSIDLLQEGRKLAKKDPEPPSTGRNK